ncbi:hypothetical protein F2Q69_00029893 [Brassica cretica]|uniref:Uncharacterized protein n=1 Tax=Brassica cretica TaxID=69181 RepID=A0A8S9SA45_BRACR|nr:hypothetical protein F2Q69_00029893 [Brassica cretica]
MESTTAGAAELQDLNGVPVSTSRLPERLFGRGTPEMETLLSSKFGRLFESPVARCSNFAKLYTRAALLTMSYIPQLRDVSMAKQRKNQFIPLFGNSLGATRAAHSGLAIY